MNRRLMAIIMVCILTAGLVGCGNKKQNVPLQTSAVNVTVCKAEKDDINKTADYTGEVMAASTASVSAKVSASVEGIYVDVGDYVEAGDVLMTLDSTQYRLAYNQASAAYNQANASKQQASAAYNSALAAKNSAEAARKSAEAAKEGAMAGKSSAEAAKQSAEAGKSSAEASYSNVADGSLEQSRVSMNQAVANAQSAYDTALDNYNRQKSLYDIGAISKVALDSAETSMNNAKIALDSAKKNAELNESVIIPQTEAGANAGISQANAGIAQAEAGIAQADAGISQADAGLIQADAGIAQANAGVSQAEAGVVQATAGIEQAKVALDIAANNLTDCTITAPISGYITAKNFNVGQIASPGVEAFVIKNSDMLDVEINVTESVISSVKEKAVALVSVKSANAENIEGTITVVSEAKNERTGMYPVRIAIPNEDSKIKIGMMADVALPTDSTEGALTIDFDALIMKNEQYYVYVANGDTAEKRKVEVGITDGKKAEITKGLKAGEKVVVEGKDFLSEENNKIRIVK